MPGAGVECAIQVCDQVLLGEVQFDLTEQFWPQQRPQLERGEPVRFEGALRCFLARFTPPCGERVLGVDPVFVGAS